MSIATALGCKVPVVTEELVDRDLGVVTVRLCGLYIDVGAECVTIGGVWVGASTGRSTRASMSKSGWVLLLEVGP
ncbi:MAG: hypothetical protein OXS33_09955, partial [bacterium]|nr:hypothetical protein [bacterium]